MTGAALPARARAWLAAGAPGDGAALAAAARAAAEAGEAEAAVTLADAAVGAAPGDAALGLEVALLHARLGRPAAAAAAARPALGRADARLADRLGMLGDALCRLGAVEAATALLRVAWRASPRPAMRRTLLAAGLPAYRRSLNEAADGALLAEMAEAAGGAIGAMPAEDLVELVRLAEEAGRDDLVRGLGLAALAAGEAGRARRIAGIDAAPAQAAGLALLATGRAARAGIAFEAALAAAPDDPAARFNAGAAALAAGDAARAAALLDTLPACGAAAMEQAAWPCFAELPWPFGAPPAAAQAGLAALLPAGASWPRIRLVTPCLNPGPWLEETILSVAAQGYPAVEHVVVDGGSTDGTAQVLARHRDRLHAVIVGPDGGPAEAIMKGLAGSAADLVGWINADDLLAPGALLRLGAAFAAAPQADIVHGVALPHRARRILGVQRPLADGPAGFTVEGLADVFGRWAAGAFFLQPEALVARRFWERLGGRLDTRLAACFDVELWLRAAQAGARVAQVGWPAAFYRVHAAQRTAGRAALAAEHVALRDRFAAPAPPAARRADILARLRGALAQRPARLLLVDARAAETMSAAAREEARAALAAGGVALSIAADIPPGPPAADIVLRILRAHDGADWVAPLRAAGFAGPVAGWLVEDDRDPFANHATALGLDLVVPARAARRSALLQEAALVLPALAPPCGLLAVAEAEALLAGAMPPDASAGAARLAALLDAPAAAGGAAPALALLAGEAPAIAPALGEDEQVPGDAAARRRRGLSLLLAPRLLALVAALRGVVAAG